MKKFGKVAVILTVILSIMLPCLAYAEGQVIDLPSAKVGQYYHQEKSVAEVLAGTEYADMAPYVEITGITLVSGEVPSGLEYSYTRSSVVFKGTPTKEGTYTFTVNAKGSIPLMGINQQVPVTCNMVVEAGDVVPTPTPTPTPKYEKPTFVTAPNPNYEVNSGGSVNVSVAAKCAEKCDFTLYIKNGSAWNALATIKGTNSCSFKPLELASKQNSVGTHAFKVVAANASDNTLSDEVTFNVKVVSTVTKPTSAVVSGSSTYDAGKALNLSCSANGTDPTYTWYIKRTTDGSYQKLSATGKTLSFITEAGDHGAKIKCVVSNSAGSLESNEITLTVVTPHVHSYGAWTVSKAPTCTAKGTETRSCSCGDVQSRSVEAKGHTNGTQWVIDQKATCTEAGEKSIRCTECNEKVQKMPIAATGHAFSEWKVVKEATEAEEGLEEKTCKNCNAKETQTIPKKSSTHIHAYGDWIVEKAATCTENGTKSRVCAECKEKQTTDILAEGHRFPADYTVIKAPTCTEKGQKAKKCAVCSALTSKEDIDALGHSLSAWEVVIQPTVEKEGLEEQRCTRAGCDYRKEKTIAKLVDGHTHLFSEWTISIAPGCLTKGEEKRTCSCGAFETNELEPSGHKFGPWEVTLEPNTERDGVETRKCTECSKSERRTVAKLTDKEPDTTPDGSATPVPDTPAPTVTPTDIPETKVPGTESPSTNIPVTKPTDVGDGDDSLPDNAMGFLIIGIAGGVLISVLAITVITIIKKKD